MQEVYLLYFGFKSLEFAGDFVFSYNRFAVQVYCAACEFGPTSFRMVPAFFSMVRFSIPGGSLSSLVVSL